MHPLTVSPTRHVRRAAWGKDDHSILIENGRWLSAWIGAESEAAEVEIYHSGPENGGMVGGGTHTVDDKMGRIVVGARNPYVGLIQAPLIIRPRFESRVGVDAGGGYTTAQQWYQFLDLVLYDGHPAFLPTRRADYVDKVRSDEFQEITEALVKRWPTPGRKGFSLGVTPTDVTAAVTYTYRVYGCDLPFWNGGAAADEFPHKIIEGTFTSADQNVLKRFHWEGKYFGYKLTLQASASVSPTDVEWEFTACDEF
jgi:hypothetical protein